MNNLTISGKEFSSRLFLGTGIVPFEQMFIFDA
jgi:thiazole synthase ThiGH ThiG subunit